MPTPSPLTGTPMHLIQETSHIEQIVHPPILRLEQYTVPRFSSTTEAQAAFAKSEPKLHQLRWISSLGPKGLQIYNGTEWAEYADFALIRDLTAVMANSVQRTSTVMGNLNELALPVSPGALYKVEAYFIYWAPFGTSVLFNFAFPQASTLSTGAFARSPDSVNSSDADVIRTNNYTNRSSGDTQHVAGGLGVNITGIPMFVQGTFRCGAVGNFTPQYARQGGATSTNVHVLRDSWLTLKRIA